MDVLEVVASTCDPAFAEDCEGTIVAWNGAAEELLGYRQSQVLGRKCWEVLRGRDVYQNRYCGKHCPLRDLAFRGEPVRTAQMFFRKAAGDQIQVSNCCMVLGHRIRSQAALVHVLSPAAPPEELRTEVAARPPAGDTRVRLTARQQEILRLLADGRGTQEISELLGISVATTRNHIQGILGKLKVHNRLAATLLARRLGLV